MADHHIRVILEAIDKGSANARRFFSNTEKGIDNLRQSVRGLKKEEEEIFLFGGGRGRRGAGGRFERERSNIEKATDSLKKFKRELKDTFGGQLAGGLSSGLGEEREVRKLFDERKKLSKKAIADEKQLERDGLEDQLDEIRKFFDAKKRLEEQSTIVEIKARHNALAKEKADEANFLEDQIRAERRAAIQQGLSFQPPKGLRDRINLLRQEEDQIKANRDTEIDAVRKRISEEEKFEKVQARRQSRERLSLIQPEDDVTLLRNIRAEVRGLSDDIDRDDNRIRRFGISAGRAFGQFRSGVRLARNGLSDTEKELLKSSSAAERFGAHLGNAIRPAGAFRTRILLLIGALQILGTLVVQLGAALVALASSAIQAAAALGGALLAGVSQLLPIVGLLAAAFSRLGAVLDAAKIADKLNLTRNEDQKAKLDGIRQAVQRLSDARFSLKKAGEAVADAEYDLAQAHIAVKDAIKDQKDAVTNLAEARKQAARDIVDANFEEKEAALALANAEIAVRDAKRALREEEQNAQLSQQNIKDAQAQVKEAQARLAQARAEGDQEEIAVALRQLSEAERTLSDIQTQATKSKDDIRQAKLDVKQAELQQKEAIVRNKRAQEDAKKARQNGIEGSDRVKSAQEQLVQATRQVAQANRQVALAERGIRDSVRALAVAKREEKDAEDALTDSRKKATAQQQQLQNALGDLSPAERKLFKSIQRIKDIFKKNFRPITDIIINSFANALDTIAPLFQDPKILSGARKLATAIAESVEKLSEFTVSPEFKRFLVFTIENAANNVPKITDGFIALGKVLIRVATAATPLFNNLLDRFVKFLQRLEEGTRDPKKLDRFFGIAARHLDSWIRFFGAVGRVLGLLIKFSAPAGKGLLDDLTNKLDEWADWLSTHGKEVREFFKNVRIQVGALGGALAKMAVILFKAFSSKEASDLSILILNTLIPAFALFLQMLGLLAKLLNFIFSIPVVGPLVQDVIKLGLALLIATKFAATLYGPIARLRSLFIALGQTTIFLRIQLLALAAFEKVAVAVAAGIKLIGAALRFVFITNPWIAIVAGIITAIVLLDRKFHFLAPTIKFIGKIFKDIFEWIKKHWKLLTVIILGPFGLVVLAVIKWRDKIIGFFKDVIDWVKQHWKLLIVAAILAPFTIGGLIILGIIKWKDRLLEIIKAIPNKIVEFFKKLPGDLKKLFDKIPGLLKEALKGLGGIVKSALQKIPVVGRFFGGGKSDEEKINDMLKDKSLDKQDKDKIRRLKQKGLSGKEIVIKLAEDHGITAEEAGKLIIKYGFQHGGHVPGQDGEAVPIMAHAGEWVLNRGQQFRLAKQLGESVDQVQKWLFGSNRGKGKPGPNTTGTRATSREQTYSYRNFNLVPQTDPDGIIVWFLELDNGTFAQVNARDAKKIIASNGNYIPGYIYRMRGGFSAPLRTVKRRIGGSRGSHGSEFKLGGIVQAFANGGVVQNWAMPKLQSFAEGGTVLQQGGLASIAPPAAKNFEQNFNVTTKGETDWNYVMRLGAIHAQSSYT